MAFWWKVGFKIWTSVLQHAKINLASLRFGAGLKGKVIDGMRNGTPTIATAIGAEGIPDFSSVHDNPEEFSNAAIATYIDKTIWSQLQKDGLTSINLHFAKRKRSYKVFR